MCWYLRSFWSCMNRKSQAESNFLLEGSASENVLYASLKQHLWRASESPGSTAEPEALCSVPALHLAAVKSRDVTGSHMLKWSILLSQMREEESSFCEVKRLTLKCPPKTLFPGKRKESCSLSFTYFFQLIICFSGRKTIAEQTPCFSLTSLHLPYCTFGSMSNGLLPSAILLLHSKLLLVLSIYSVLSFSPFHHFLVMFAQLSH